MDAMIEWLKHGIDEAYLSTEDAFEWLARKAMMRVEVTEIPARVSSRADASDKPRRAHRRTRPAGTQLLKKDGSPRKPPGRKPKAPDAPPSNGVED